MTKLLQQIKLTFKRWKRYLSPTSVNEVEPEPYDECENWSEEEKRELLESIVANSFDEDAAFERDLERWEEQGIAHAEREIAAERMVQSS